jgi:hypothetical protein
VTFDIFFSIVEIYLGLDGMPREHSSSRQHSDRCRKWHTARSEVCRVWKLLPAQQVHCHLQRECGINFSVIDYLKTVSVVLKSLCFRVECLANQLGLVSSSTTAATPSSTLPTTESATGTGFQSCVFEVKQACD